MLLAQGDTEVDGEASYTQRAVKWELTLPQLTKNPCKELLITLKIIPKNQIVVLFQDRYFNHIYSSYPPQKNTEFMKYTQNISTDVFESKLYP